jgi:hypothetical protein
LGKKYKMIMMVVFGKHLHTLVWWFSVLSTLNLWVISVNFSKIAVPKSPSTQ